MDKKFIGQIKAWNGTQGLKPIGEFLNIHTTPSGATKLDFFIDLKCVTKDKTTEKEYPNRVSANITVWNNQSWPVADELVKLGLKIGDWFVCDGNLGIEKYWKQDGTVGEKVLIKCVKPDMELIKKINNLDGAQQVAQAQPQVAQAQPQAPQVAPYNDVTAQPQAPQPPAQNTQQPPAPVQNDAMDILDEI